MPLYEVSIPNGKKYRVNSPEPLTQEQVWQAVQGQIGAVAPEQLQSTAELEAAKSAPFSFGDVAKSFGSGLIGGAKSLTDVFGAGKDVSKGLGEAQSYLQQSLTPERQAEIARRQELESRAAQSGSLFQEAKAFLGGVAEAPLQSLTQAAGSSAPSILAGIAAIPAGAPAALALGVGTIAKLSVGALQGVGEYKGSVFDAVKAEYIKQGRSPEEAERLAEAAQQYSRERAFEIGGSAVLGALDAVTGVEPSVGKAMRKVSPTGQLTKEAIDAGISALPEKAVKAPSRLGQFARGVAEEAPLEGAQGAFGQYGQNVALQQAGADVTPMEGVLGAGLRDAAVGALFGGAASPLGMKSARQEYATDQFLRQAKVEQEREQQKVDALKRQQEERAKLEENLGVPKMLALPAPAKAAEIEKDPLQDPVGRITEDELGKAIGNNTVVNYLNRYRKDNNLPKLKSYSIEDIKDAMTAQNPEGEEGALNAILAYKTNYQNQTYTPTDIQNIAVAKNVATDTKGFSDFLTRATGKSDLNTMTQPELHSVATALDALKRTGKEEQLVLPEGSNATRFTQDQYNTGLTTALGTIKPGKPVSLEQAKKAVQAQTGLETDRDAESLLRAAAINDDLTIDRGTGYQAVSPTGAVLGTYGTETEAKRMHRRAEIKPVETELVTPRIEEATRPETELPEGYQIQKQDTAGSEAPAAYVIREDGSPKNASQTFAEEADAKERLNILARKREANAAAEEASADRVRQDLEKRQAAIAQMEADGKTGTPEHTKAVYAFQAANVAGSQKITDHLDKAEALRTPLKIVPLGKKSTKVAKHTVIKDGKVVASFDTNDKAQAHVLSLLNDKDLESIANRGGVMGKRAEAELADRAKPGIKVRGTTEGLEKAGVHTPDVEAKLAELKAKLLPMLKKFGLEEVGLNVVRAIENDADGAWGKADKLIRIALQATEPIKTMRHEALHALKELGFFTPQQWEALKRQADKTWVNKYLKGQMVSVNGKEMTRYDAYANGIKDENGEWVLKPLSPEDILEEAIADAFGNWEGGAKPPPGMMAALFKRMQQFFAALRQALTGAGFESADDIFGKIERGELKADKEAAGAESKMSLPVQKEGRKEIDPNDISRLVGDGSYNNAALRVINSQIDKTSKPLEVDDVGMLFDQAYLDEFKTKGDWKNPADFQRAVNQAVAELKHQIQQAKSGLDWYDEDIAEAFKQTQRYIPSLKKPEKRALFSVIAGIMSPSVNARDNWVIAAQAYQHYEKTGTLPGSNPATGGLWQGGLESANKKKQLDMLNAMLQPKSKGGLGEKATIEWLQGNHTVAEINNFRQKYGGMGRSSTGGKAADILPGFTAFGPKVGPFVMNINGIHEVTVDVWMTRTFNRYFGQMMGADGKMLRAPTEPQRVAIKKLAIDAANQLGIKPYQVQSVLWFFEQNLFNKLGTGAKSYGFSDGAIKFIESQGGVGIPKVSSANVGANAVANQPAGQQTGRAGVQASKPTVGKPQQGVKGEQKLSLPTGKFTLRSSEGGGEKLAGSDFDTAGFVGPAGFGQTSEEHDVRRDREVGKRPNVEVKQGDGRGFTGFFSNISLGFKGKPNAKPYEPTLNVEPISNFVREYNKHRGNFDDHIATSIPGFREVQTIVGDAIAKTYKNADMLDIGASEGALIKAVTKMSNGGVRTVALDPNFAMAKHFNDGEAVEGSVYDTSAFGIKADEGQLAWTEDATLTDRDGQVTNNPFAGEEVRWFKPDRQFDVIHEAMVFQFISGNRASQIARAKELMKPNGVLIIEEKFVAGDQLSPEQFRANEAQKDAYKEQYFTKAEIAAKAKAVGVAEKAAFQESQQKKEQQVTGMNDLMVSPGAIEDVLSSNFDHVAQFWDSGNFKGYIASDSASAVERLINNMLPTDSEFANVKTPRTVKHSTLPADKGIVLGVLQPDAVEFSGVHYGNVQTNELQGSKYGTGIRGSERRRLQNTDDERIKNRIYFYVKKPDGTTPIPEAGVGHHVYTQKFKNILGPGKKMDEISKEAGGDFNYFESSIVDAGYDGYAIPDMGMMVILNHDVPVNYRGTRAELPEGKVKLSLRKAGEPATKENVLAAMTQAQEIQPYMNCQLCVQMATGVSKLLDLPKVKEAKPGDVYTFGERKNMASHYAVDLGDGNVAEVEEWGADVREVPLSDVVGEYGEPDSIRRPPATAYTGEKYSLRTYFPTAEAAEKAAYKKAPPETAEFKRFFGASKVMEEGRAQPMYHASMEEFNIFRENRPIFISPDAEFAEDFIKRRMSESGSLSYLSEGAVKKKTAKIYPLWVRAETPFDYDNKMHVQKVVDYLQANNQVSGGRIQMGGLGLMTPEDIAKGLSQGKWTVIEDGKTQEALKALGFDSFYTSEGGAKNLAVFKANQVKSITGNIGDFSLETKDMRFSLKKVRYSDERFNKLWNQSYYTQNDAENKVKGFLAFVNPMDFVLATAPPDTFERLRKEQEPLDFEKMRNYDQVPSLSISDRDGEWKIIGHEGRHRMLALHDAGYREVPIYIDLPADNTKSIPVKTLPAQYPNAISSILALREIEPLSYANRDKAKAKFTQMDSEVKYSLPTISTAASTRRDETTVRREGKGVIQRILDSFAPETLADLRASFIHRYNQLGVYDKMLAEKMGGKVLLADVSAEAAANMSDLSASVTYAAFGIGNRKGGVPVYKNGMTTIDTSVKGPLEILSPLAQFNDPVAYQDYQYWAGVKRGKRFMADGREKNFDAGDIALADEVRKAYFAKGVDFNTIQKEMNSFNDGLVDYMIKTGVLSPEKGAEFKRHMDYIPFFRQMNGEKTVGPKIFNAISGVKPPKKLKGSEAPLTDYLESIVQNTQAAINAGMKNTAAQKAVNVAMQLGPKVGAERLNTIDNGPDTVQVLENGKQVSYRVADQLFINAVKSLNMAEIPFLGFLSAPSNLLRNLVTKDPGFMLANLARDSLSSWVVGGSNATPIVGTAVNFMKALGGKAPSYHALLNAGILGGYEFSSGVAQSGQVLEADLAKKYGSKGAAAPLKVFKGIWDALEHGTEASDAATRMAVYDRVLQETGNETEALYRALEVMNFNRRGSSPVVRILTAAIPFLNARIQGLDVFYRAAWGRNVSQNAEAMQKAFFVRGMTLMALSSAYFLAVSDDDEWKKQEQETKDNYWIAPGIGKFPTPFEVGFLFKTMPERVLAYTMRDDTGQDFMDSMRRGLVNTFAFNPIPQIAKPLVEYSANYNFFTGRPIVGQGMEGKEAQYQVGPNTTKVAEILGQSLGLSPLKLDQLINSYTGTLGVYAMTAIDSVLNSQDNSPNASKRFEQMPIIKRFAVDPEARGNITQYYELKRAVDAAVETQNYLLKAGKPEEFAEFAQKNAGLLATKQYVANIEKTMKQMREMRKMVQGAEMTADEKRDTLTAIGQAENNLNQNIQTIKKMISQF